MILSNTMPKNVICSKRKEKNRNIADELGPQVAARKNEDESNQ